MRWRWSRGRSSGVGQSRSRLGSVVGLTEVELLVARRAANATHLAVKVDGDVG